MTCSATFSRDSDWLDMLLLHVSQIVASGSSFFSLFLSQPLIMSDVNDVILLEIDRCLNYTKCERIK